MCLIGLYKFSARIATSLIRLLLSSGRVCLPVRCVCRVGHFFVENNKPASFIYPTYSLWGDFNMVYLILRGEVTIF